jgi:hypothetical protein
MEQQIIGALVTIITTIWGYKAVAAKMESRFDKLEDKIDGLQKRKADKSEVDELRAKVLRVVPGGKAE